MIENIISELVSLSLYGRQYSRPLTKYEALQSINDIKQYYNYVTLTEDETIYDEYVKEWNTKITVEYPQLTKIKEPVRYE